MKENITDIANRIGKLDNNEINELTEKLLNFHNISATIYRFGSISIENDSEQTCKLILRETGNRKLAMIKEIKEMFGLGLKESKDIIDNAPCYLSESIERDIALKIKTRLENIGAEVEIQ